MKTDVLSLILLLKEREGYGGMKKTQISVPLLGIETATPACESIH